MNWHLCLEILLGIVGAALVLGLLWAIILGAVLAIEDICYQKIPRRPAKESTRRTEECTAEEAMSMCPG